MSLMKALFTLLIVLIGTVFVSAQNEQAPIVEKDIAYKDWTYKSVRDGKELKLTDLVRGKKLVAVVYYAPWCPNWRHDAPMLERLYEKYRSDGFEIVAVGEYDPVSSMRTNLDALKLTFPTVYESESRDAKQKTLHYDYRRSTGDNRSWGSPWYIFLEPASFEKKGDLLSKKTSVINGEMIETEGERFIRQKLGLPAEVQKLGTTDARSQEICDPERQTTSLKKP